MSHMSHTCGTVVGQKTRSPRDGDKFTDFWIDWDFEVLLGRPFWTARFGPRARFGPPVLDRPSIGTIQPRQLGTSRYLEVPHGSRLILGTSLSTLLLFVGKLFEWYRTKLCSNAGLAWCLQSDNKFTRVTNKHRLIRTNYRIISVIIVHRTLTDTRGVASYQIAD